ncbi:hypothetical protein KIL84_012105 [Mauremys mutica]|uniref:Uncharacterized protein n=1 Tax=Mauremys mutica TaxID=74926 RepID=A0A9D3XFG9_9SAUR|nr:hypothetical protein KIL84_012105 [Mauremys mutica]
MDIIESTFRSRKSFRAICVSYKKREKNLNRMEKREVTSCWYLPTYLPTCLYGPHRNSARAPTGCSHDKWVRTRPLTTPPLPCSFKQFTRDLSGRVTGPVTAHRLVDLHLSLPCTNPTYRHGLSNMAVIWACFALGCCVSSQCRLHPLVSNMPLCLGSMELAELFIANSVGYSCILVLVSRSLPS